MGGSAIVNVSLVSSLLALKLPYDQSQVVVLRILGRKVWPDLNIELYFTWQRYVSSGCAGAGKSEKPLPRIARNGIVFGEVNIENLLKQFNLDDLPRQLTNLLMPSRITV